MDNETMVVECYNCGRVSVSAEEWELVRCFKWMVIRNERDKKMWFCESCLVVGFDLALNFPARIRDNKN